MKRVPMPQRTKAISRHVSIKAVSPERKAKRKARKPRLKASVRKAVLIRDGNQCTMWDVVAMYRVEGQREAVAEFDRCPETEGLEVHHEHYKQTPENPLDGLKLLCRYHHHQVEAALRPWNFR